MWLKTVLHQNDLVILPIKRKVATKASNELTLTHGRTAQRIRCKMLPLSR